MLTPREIEIAARKLCELREESPDEEIVSYPNGITSVQFNWMVKYKEIVDAGRICEAIEFAKPQPPNGTTDTLAERLSVIQKNPNRIDIVDAESGLFGCFERIDSNSAWAFRQYEHRNGISLEFIEELSRISKSLPQNPMKIVFRSCKENLTLEIDGHATLMTKEDFTRLHEVVTMAFGKLFTE